MNWKIIALFFFLANLAQAGWNYVNMDDKRIYSRGHTYKFKEMYCDNEECIPIFKEEYK